MARNNDGEQMEKSEESLTSVVTEVPEEPSNEDPLASQSSPSSSSTEPVKSFSDLCIKLFRSLYQTEYYRKIFKSVLLFLLALKMAQESKMMKIPLTEYQPFTR